jgi:hypothetical protein
MSKRPETGKMKFGDDWTGVFIRGDSAAAYAMTLRSVLESAKVDASLWYEVGQVQFLIDLLESSTEWMHGTDRTQVVEDFNKCYKGTLDYDGNLKK